MLFVNGNNTLSLSPSSGIQLATGGGNPSVLVQSTGITTAQGGSNNYSVNITSSNLTMAYNGTPYLTLNSSGLTLAAGCTITSPSISGGSINGTSLTLNLNGVTTSINNASYAGLYNGLVVN